MTAHERYQYLVGEIGISRLEYLYELQFWEIILIVKGYSHRNREMWSATRWQTFCLMLVQADLKKAGIYGPIDLMRFPWEDGSANSSGPTKEQYEALQREMREHNAKVKP